MGYRLHCFDQTSQCLKDEVYNLDYNYATKWVEARATRRNDVATIALFLFEEIKMRFGHPLKLVSNRGIHFLNNVIRSITNSYLIKHWKTTPYNSKVNGLIEQANGILGKILNKMASTHKTNWDQKLASIVHAYNTLEKSTTDRSPFFLVFGQAALLKIEMEVETFKVIASRRGDWITNAEIWLLAIEDLEEARRDTLQRTITIQGKRKLQYDVKLPKDHGIEGGYVLLYDICYEEFWGKLHTRWMEPYKVLKNLF